jgi:multicomponent Na+:H+ antiporter subunit G
VRLHLGEALLALAVLMAWLATVGFARLTWPLERLHCVSFANVTCGALILASAVLWGGPADDLVKLAMLLAVLLVGGAAIAHATARAIVRRRTKR